MRKIGRFKGESALVFACALMPAACGGQSTESVSTTPESVCQLPGARDAKLPIELTAFGSEAMGAGPRGVYLAESLGEGRLVEVSRLGGTARTLATNLFYVEIRSNGDDIYVIAQGFAGGGSALYRVTPGQQLALLDANLHGANDLAITPTSLYLADSYDQVIYRYDRNGGGRQQVADHVGTAHLAVSGETLYYLATPDTGEGLYRLDPELGAVFLSGAALGAPARLFILDGLLYAAGDGIQAYDLTNGVQTTVSDAPEGIDDVVRIDDTFYLTTGIFQGDLWRVPVAGGTAEVLDQKLGYGGIATDGISVFYDSGQLALTYCPPLGVSP